MSCPTGNDRVRTPVIIRVLVRRRLVIVQTYLAVSTYYRVISAILAYSCHPLLHSNENPLHSVARLLTLDTEPGNHYK
jgi:hypothetical protein